MSVSRRTFLKSTAAVTAATTMNGAVQTVLGNSTKRSAGTSLNKWPGRVAVNFNKNAVTDYGNKTVDKDVVKTMVDEAILELTRGDRETNDVGDAWKTIFPSTLTATSKIAIKTNFYELSICPAPEVLYYIAAGLREMPFGEQKFTGDITIFEGNTNNSFSQAKYDDNEFDGIDVTLKKCQGSDYSNGADPAEGESQYVKLLDDADFLINVFSARGHNDYAERVSLGFKSHYGTYINSPMGTIHGTPGFSQRVRNLHCTGVISKKQVLSVSCAFYCNNEGDPMGNVSVKDFSTYSQSMDATADCQSPSTLIMSTDAISCEMQAIKLLRSNTMPPGKYGSDDMPKYLRASAGIEGALSDATYNIGIIDESKMDVRQIINGVGPVSVSIPAPKRSSSAVSLHVTPLRGQHSTFIEYILPESEKNASARLLIHDLQGRLVFSKMVTVNGVRNRFSWNQRSTHGLNVKSGKYVCSLINGNIKRTASFILF